MHHANPENLYFWIYKILFAITLKVALHLFTHWWVISFFMALLWSLQRCPPISCKALCLQLTHIRELLFESWHLERLPCWLNHAKYCVSFVSHTWTWLTVVVVIRLCCAELLGCPVTALLILIILSHLLIQIKTSTIMQSIFTVMWLWWRSRFHKKKDTLPQKTGQLRKCFFFIKM